MSEAYALELNIVFETINCYKCHAPFAVDRKAKERWRASGDTFYCPYCGSPQGFAKTKIAQLEEVLERQKERTQRADDRAKWYEKRMNREEYRARAFRGQVTKIKNRVSNGVCPCCNRTFQNLHEHMKKQHPEWNEKD